MECKKIIWVSLLVTALMFVSQASAELLDGESLLPESSLYSGYTYYGEEVENSKGVVSYMQGRIDFAVYDTTAGNEWALGDDGIEGTSDDYVNPGSGQYVYAYQIFNDYDGYSEVPIEAFSILGLDGAKISIDETSIQTAEDPLFGQDAAGSSFDDTSVTWDFSYSAAGDYTIGITEHSFFLIFSSDYSWVKGDYSLTAYEAPTPVPGDGTTANADGTLPEPVTVALLGFGGLITVLKRKRK